ncbi:hypothetical protein ACOSQ2_014041 [Xanthoceras sorbifolium]
MENCSPMSKGASEVSRVMLLALAVRMEPKAFNTCLEAAALLLMFGRVLVEDTGMKIGTMGISTFGCSVISKCHFRETGSIYARGVLRNSDKTWLGGFSLNRSVGSALGVI